jgi:hypothetical protein
MKTLLIALTFLSTTLQAATIIKPKNLELQNEAILDILSDKISDEVESATLSLSRNMITEIHKGEDGKTTAIVVESYVYAQAHDYDYGLLGEFDSECVSTMTKDRSGHYSYELTKTVCDYTNSDYLSDFYDTLF